MPIYEFFCPACGSEFERLIMGAQASVACPSCGAQDVERLLSVFGVKSGGKFTSSAGSSCDGCKPASPSVCKTCR